MCTVEVQVSLGDKAVGEEPAGDHRLPFWTAYVDYANYLHAFYTTFVVYLHQQNFIPPQNVKK
jgi:hypothetical protein